MIRYDVKVWLSMITVIGFITSATVILGNGMLFLAGDDKFAIVSSYIFSIIIFFTMMFFARYLFEILMEW